MKNFNTYLLSVISGVAALCISTFASAESFSFTSTSEPTSGISVALPDGRTVGIGSNKGVSAITWASGATTENSFVCSTATQPESELFASTGVCEITDTDGSQGSIIFGCNPINEDGTETNCVGGLVGKSGIYEGRRGTIGWHGKVATSAGAGHWND